MKKILIYLLILVLAANFVFGTYCTSLPKDQCNGGECPQNYICRQIGEQCACQWDVPEFSTYGIIAGIVIIGAVIFYYLKRKKK